mgnify:CR=1 FL=1
MGLWGAICSIGASIAGAVMGSPIVQAAMSFGTSIAASVATMSIPQVLLAVYTCILIAKELGILQPEQNEKDVEELGNKVIQADEKGIRPDKYKTYDEYMKEIENFKVDPVKTANIDQKDKLSKGLGLLSTLVTMVKPDYKSILEMSVNGLLPSMKAVADKTGVSDKMKTDVMSVASNYMGALKNSGVGFKELADFLTGKNENREIFNAKMKADKEFIDSVHKINDNEKK